MKQTRLGRSTLEVPAIGLGCGPLGGVHMMSDTQADDVLNAAWNAGIRYFDTAPWYGNTQSEHRVGRFLRGKPRESFRITTKVGRLYRPTQSPADFANSRWAKRWPCGLPFEPHFDYSYDGIMRSHEDSLMRLGLARVDGVAIHDLDIRHQQTEDGIAEGFQQLEAGGYRALVELKESRQIQAIGAGINFPGLIPRFLERFEIDYFLLAMPYTLLDQQSLELDLPCCEKAGSSVLIGAPFASGILATGAIENAQYAYSAASESVLARVRKLEQTGERFGVRLTAAALQVPLSHPCVAGVISGADSKAQVLDNVSAFEDNIPAGYWEALLQEGQIDKRTPIAVV